MTLDLFFKKPIFGSEIQAISVHHWHRNAPCIGLNFCQVYKTVNFLHFLYRLNLYFTQRTKSHPAYSEFCPGERGEKRNIVRRNWWKKDIFSNRLVKIGGKCVRIDRRHLQQPQERFRILMGRLQLYALQCLNPISTKIFIWILVLLLRILVLEIQSVNHHLMKIWHHSWTKKKWSKLHLFMWAECTRYKDPISTIFVGSDI